MLVQKLNASLDRLIEGLIALLFAAMVLVGGLQVFNRFVINQSLSWGGGVSKIRSHLGRFSRHSGRL